jgi:hypothetical protein
MISNLQRRPEQPACTPRKRRPKGWTPERRAQQSARIRLWQPWRRSTGPRSETGKAQSSMNGLKHGDRSLAHLMEYRRARFDLRRVRYVLNLAARNIAILKTHNRITRLEHSLAGKSHAPETALRLTALRHALANLTSAAPLKRPEIRFFTPPALSS